MLLFLVNEQISTFNLYILYTFNLHIWYWKKLTFLLYNYFIILKRQYISNIKIVIYTRKEYDISQVIGEKDFISRKKVFSFLI